MKRRLIICSSLITIILSCFSFPIFAEETVQDSSNLHSLSDGVFLDQYFYDNYDILPYLVSDSRTQYIDTDIQGNSDLIISCVVSDIQSSGFLYGTNMDNSNKFNVYVNVGAVSSFFSFTSAGYYYLFRNDPYLLNNISFGEDIYFNYELIHQFDANFTSDVDIYIFGSNNGTGLDGGSNFKLYKFSIYDSSDDEYVRYYYPAKSKSSGTLGLYDAVSKTFFTSGGSVPFSNPTNEYVEEFQISSFLTNSLTWIGQIFDAIIEIPIIIVFMAIGLAGAMFRWGRRIVHF